MKVLEKEFIKKGGWTVYSIGPFHEKLEASEAQDIINLISEISSPKANRLIMLGLIPKDLQVSSPKLNEILPTAIRSNVINKSVGAIYHLKEGNMLLQKLWRCSFNDPVCMVPSSQDLLDRDFSLLMRMGSTRGVWFAEFLKILGLYSFPIGLFEGPWSLFMFRGDDGETLDLYASQKEIKRIDLKLNQLLRDG